jgi:hypothetical protein
LVYYIPLYYFAIVVDIQTTGCQQMPARVRISLCVTLFSCQGASVRFVFFRLDGRNSNEPQGQGSAVKTGNSTPTVSQKATGAG